MIRVQRELGRLVSITCESPVDPSEALQLQQTLSQTLRRIGDPAILLTDLRGLGAVDVFTLDVLTAMLASPPLIVKHAIISQKGTVGDQIAADVYLRRGEAIVPCWSAESASATRSRAIWTPA